MPHWQERAAHRAGPLILEFAGRRYLNRGDDSRPEIESVVRPWALSALTAAAGLSGLLILAQAALAGRFLNVAGDGLKAAHSGIGNVVVLLAIAQVALPFVAGMQGRLKSPLIGMTALFLVLIVAQVGLGYTGRNNVTSASLHIPNGVLLFGLAMSNISMALRAMRAASL